MGGVKKIEKDQISFYCWIFSIVSVLSLAGLVSWVSLTPKGPRFRISVELLPEAKDNASLPSASSLIIDLEVSNPNKRMGIYYNDGIILELLRGGNGVWRNSTLGFYQGFKNVTVFRVPIHGNQESWQATNGGSMDFVIRVGTDVRFGIMKWKTKMHHIEHEEQFSHLKIDSLNGTLSGGNYPELRNATEARVRN